METKRCLFCEQTVPVMSRGEYLYFEGCYCAPGSNYRLHHAYFQSSQSVGYREKSELFPLLSGHIREQIENHREVVLDSVSIEQLRHSMTLPATIEEKSIRLLRYLYRRIEEPNGSLYIHRLSEQFNLTYSPNLQEFIYIIERLKEAGHIERSGSSLRLTADGWTEAAKYASFSDQSRCAVLLPQDEELREAWKKDVVPALEQLGYAVSVVPEESERADSAAIGGDCRLVIAELSAASPSTWYAAGIAEGMRIPILWTAKREAAGEGGLPIRGIQLIRWYDTTQLADQLIRSAAEHASRPA